MSSFVEWAAHGIKAGRSMDRRLALLGLLGILVVVSVIAGYLILVSHVATTGRHMEQLESELAHLQRRNALLELQIAQESSIPNLQQRTRQLGFEVPEHVMFLQSWRGD